MIPTDWNKRVARCLIIAGIAGLAACAVTSPPIKYLQLSAGELMPPPNDRPRIAVDAVRVPDYLLRDELLLRDGEYSLRYSADRRWAEPLDLGIQRVLGRRLGAALKTRQVSLFPAVPRGKPDWELRVEVRRFAMLGDRAELSATGIWTRGDATGEQQEHVEFDAAMPLSDTRADAAIALSELLWQFAAALAEPLRADTP